MIPIQHSFTDIQQGALTSVVTQPDNGDGFEAVLSTVVLEETPNPVDLNKLNAESSEDFPALDSDVYGCEDALANDSMYIMMKGVAEPEQIQSISINLSREHVQKETPAGSLVLKKSSLKIVEFDGAEMDPSMMIPLVPVDVHRPNSVAVISYELKKDARGLKPDLRKDDSLSINSIYDTAKVDSRDDASDAAIHPQSDKEMLVEITQENLSSLSVSKESVPQDQQITLMPSAQSISNMRDKSTVILGSTSAKMTHEIQSSDDDRMMDDVPIVSIALKRDSAMHGIPIKTLDFNLPPKNENLMQDQISILKPKISEVGSQISEGMEFKNDSFENEFEDVESLGDSPVKEAVFKLSQSAVFTESSEVTSEVNISKSAPTQQIQHAIVDAKDGVLPKESKTLTVILNPEELGVVNVELTADKTGKLSAVLSVEKQETLNVLQQDLHQLKTVLKEIGIDDSSVSLQLSSNNQQEHQKQSEYVAWEEREQMLARSSQTSIKTNTVEKATYPERQSTRRLDIKA